VVEQVLRADDALEGFAQVNDVDLVPATVDVRAHLRVPAGHAAAEVGAGVDQLLDV
jgi:hypothetical protein